MSRREFEMSEAQLQRITEASKPVPAMAISGGQPMFESPYDKAMRTWREIGTELGANWETIRPIAGKGARFFSAEPL